MPAKALDGHAFCRFFHSGQPIPFRVADCRGHSGQRVLRQFRPGPRYTIHGNSLARASRAGRKASRAGAQSIRGLRGRGRLRALWASAKRGRSPPEGTSDAGGTCSPDRNFFAHKRAPAASTDFPSVVPLRRYPAPTETHFLET